MHVVSTAGISQTTTITNNIDRNSSTTGPRGLEKTFSVFALIHPAVPIHFVLRYSLTFHLINKKQAFFAHSAFEFNRKKLLFLYIWCMIYATNIFLFMATENKFQRNKIKT